MSFRKCTVDCLLHQRKWTKKEPAIFQQMSDAVLELIYRNMEHALTVNLPRLSQEHGLWLFVLVDFCFYFHDTILEKLPVRAGGNCSMGTYGFVHNIGLD